MISSLAPRAVIIGAGFCGLTAAHVLAKSGVKVLVLEQDAEVGGLAGSFKVNGQSLERFYHHWFTSDLYVNGLVAEVGESQPLVRHRSRTGMYYANQFFRLSPPSDLLQFSPLPVSDRLRLGALALRARRIKDWRPLERMSAREWLISLGGRKVFDVVWSP